MVTATSADIDNRRISWFRLDEELDVEFPSSLASLVILSLQSGHVCLIFSQGSTQFLWNSWLEVKVADKQIKIINTDVVRRKLQHHLWMHVLFNKDTFHYSTCTNIVYIITPPVQLIRRVLVVKRVHRNFTYWLSYCPLLYCSSNAKVWQEVVGPNMQHSLPGMT